MSFRRLIGIAYAAACLTLPEVAAQEQQAPAARDAQTWEINARDQDIRQFITQVSQITGRPFVIDPRVKGTVTVVSTTALDPDSVSRTAAVGTARTRLRRVLRRRRRPCRTEPYTRQADWRRR